ncbi:hypothetical protein D9Q98_000031 [Chlorella vulgaris]|uniref:Uncharacterized protein n=1 Tax=Chlorella vulgaris TaxID=3077 RepID=A0A9D4TXH3_CHLVU|nr:hypothetical protein D9Q98_000031 [Chlorella vulgaris]
MAAGGGCGGGGNDGMLDSAAEVPPGIAPMADEQLLRSQLESVAEWGPQAALAEEAAVQVAQQAALFSEALVQQQAPANHGRGRQSQGR